MNLQAYANHRKALEIRKTSHVTVLKAIDSSRLHEPAVQKEGKNWVIAIRCWRMVSGPTTRTRCGLKRYCHLLQVCDR
jgi:hypothetical protein